MTAAKRKPTDAHEGTDGNRVYNYAQSHSFNDTGLLVRRIVRASVKAALPGRQNAKNVAPAEKAAMQAARRVLRRAVP